MAFEVSATKACGPGAVPRLLRWIQLLLNTNSSAHAHTQISACDDAAIPCRLLHSMHIDLHLDCINT
jgi:hypothetical protein